MTVSEFSRELECRIPSALSESWDNDGAMLIPDSDRQVKRVLVALDATTAAINRAIAIGADAIVTHHPLIFSGMKSISDSDAVGKRVIACINNGIAVFSYHTRLDSMQGGVNDCLMQVLGFDDFDSFLPFGRVATLAEQMSFEDFTALVSNRLGESPSASVKSRSVKKIAVVSGGGKDFVRDAAAIGADTYITGEASHSAYIEAHELGINMLCMTHHATERVVLSALSDIVKDIDSGIETVIFDFEREIEYGI